MYRTLLHMIFISCVLIVSVPINATSASASDEYRVKAAYIYNFAKFITWTERTDSDTNKPFIIGVLGTNNFDESLKSLATKTVRNRPIVIQQYNKPEEIENCQILYLNDTNNKVLEQSLKALSNKAIITVSSQKEFARRGGTIQFIEVRDRLRFIINKTIADKQKIKIGSQLLSLAIDVLEDK